MAAARIYRRKWVLVKLPVAVLANALSAWLWVTFLPMPPRVLTISAGVPDGVYFSYAQAYAAAFERNGVQLTVLTSEGSEMNLQRLRGTAMPEADLAFVQGGLGNAAGDRNGAGWYTLREHLAAARERLMK